MEVFTFRARSLQEALMLVRHELGPEASVVQTRQVGGKLFGLWGKGYIEVQASRDAQVMRRLPDAHTQSASQATVHAASSLGNGSSSQAALLDHVPVSASDHSIDHSYQSMEAQQPERFDMSEEECAATETLWSSDHDSDVTSPIGNREARPQPVDTAYPKTRPTNSSRPAINYLSPAMFEVFTDMLDADIDPDAARAMLQEVALHCTPAQLDDAWLIKGRLCQIVQQRIDVSGPIDVRSGDQQIIALVGPTGVGKTTTLAKLAAGFQFDQGTQVGLVTLDTFRLGAIDQLQKYADLMGAACEVVSAPDQMRPAISRLSHCHLILIDTAGRSPRDASQLQVLREYLQVARPHQTHLVLSAASSARSADLAIEHFSELQPTHLLLTKLDEAQCLGNWYRILASGRWPLSYLTTGQQVPEDIVVANRRRVASLIIGQRT